MRALRAVGTVLWVVLLTAACTGSPSATSSPSVAEPSESATASAAPSRLEELRAGEQYLEFAEHERAATAPYARLAWENFAPIVEGRRVEWTNKAELWDSIAPRIRDEALLLGPEYRSPLWDNTTAIPNSVSIFWDDGDTKGRGHYVSLLVTHDSSRGPAERVWGVLISVDADGAGRVVAMKPGRDFLEADYLSYEAEFRAVQQEAWDWVLLQPADDAS